MTEQFEFNGVIYKEVLFEENPSLKGILFCSEDGDIYHTKRRAFLKAFSDRVGYIRVNFLHEGTTKGIMVHQAVARAWIPRSSPERIEVNHIDLDKSNNHYSNLEWCTRAENILHASLNGALDKEKKSITLET